MLYHIREVTFICGRSGVCALGAVAAEYSGDEQLMNYYLNQFKGVLLFSFSQLNLDLVVK